MTFRSKRDRTFMSLIIVAIGIIALATLLPLILVLFSEESPPDMIAVWIMFALFLILAGFIIWISFDIEYTFKEEYLFVRGGLFRSRIPYEDMTKVIPTSNILAGYRILSSKDALEIHYKKALLGSVIISPEKQEEFLKILLEKASHIHFMK